MFDIVIDKYLSHRSSVTILNGTITVGEKNDPSQVHGLHREKSFVYSETLKLLE